MRRLCRGACGGDPRSTLPQVPAMDDPKTQAVLLCYDGSRHAQHAIRRAAALLQPRPAIVLHVRERASSESLAERGADLVRDLAFATVSAIDAEGDRAADAILAQAHQLRAAVIVAGLHEVSPGPHPAPLGAPPGPPTPLNGVPGTLLARSDVPVLLVPAGDQPDTGRGPMFVCYDGSVQARGAIIAAADLLAAREAIVASFLEPVDDVALLRTTLPWPPPARTEGRLARLDRQEADLLSKRTAEGVAIVSSRGITARSLGIEGQEAAWSALMDGAAAAAACCIVVGHRRATHRSSTAHAFVNHAAGAILVVPG
jgi:hypothetical protein